MGPEEIFRDLKPAERDAAFDAPNRDYRVVVYQDPVRGVSAEMEEAVLRITSPTRPNGLPVEYMEVDCGDAKFDRVAFVKGKAPAQGTPAAER